MNPRNCFEIADGLSTDDCFAYIDSADNLADFLFDQLKIDAEREMEFHHGDEPFKIVMCRIPRQQRETFLKAIGVLPGLMDYVGITGYKEYCMEIMRNAARLLKGKEAAGNTPLQ